MGPYKTFATVIHGWNACTKEESMTCVCTTKWFYSDVCNSGIAYAWLLRSNSKLGKFLSGTHCVPNGSSHCSKWECLIFPACDVLVNGMFPKERCLWEHLAFWQERRPVPSENSMLSRWDEQCYWWSVRDIPVFWDAPQWTPFNKFFRYDLKLCPVGIKQCYIHTHSCQLLQFFSNFYKFFQELRKYTFKFTNFKFSTQQKKTLIKYHFMSIWIKSPITIVKIRIGTHTEYFRTCSEL